MWALVSSVAAFGLIVLILCELLFAYRKLAYGTEPEPKYRSQCSIMQQLAKIYLSV